MVDIKQPTGYEPPQENPQSERRGIVGTVNEAIEDAAAGTNRFIDKAKDSAQSWTTSVGDTVDHAAQKSQQVASTAINKVTSWEEDVAELIRRHPYPAMAVGFACGFLMGQLCHRSSGPSWDSQRIMPS